MIRLSAAWAVVSCLWSVSGFAGVSVQFVEKSPSGVFAAGTGSRIQVQIDGQAPVEGIFLARVEKFEAPAQWMILLDDAKKIYLVDEKDLVNVPRDVDGFQKFVHPMDQEGGTCAAYAMYHMTMQLEKDGQAKLGLDDEGRMKLFAYYVSEYYLDGARRESVEKILDSMGKKFGFKCDTHRFDDSAKALEFVQARFSEGRPLLVEFDVGTDMVNSSYTTVDYAHATVAQDPRLWVPRQVGQRDGGGHAIVLASGFSDHGHAMAVVLDSDWATPRIWDLEQYLAPRARMDLVLFHSCR